MYKFFEYKLSSEQYDSYYYLVMEENGRRAIIGLLTGELVGLKGIANHTKVINVFLSYENDILLIMNKEDVNKINDIEKLKYYDVEYLVKDNFKKYKRVLGLKHSGNVLNHVMTSSNMGKFKDNDRYNKLKNICNTEPYKKLHEYLGGNINWFLEDEDLDLEGNWSGQNLDELVSIIVGKMDNLVFDEMDDGMPNYSEKMIRNILEYKIIGTSSYYADEEEYIVKSDTFKIPEQSTIIIHNPSKAYINELEFRNLEKKYKIKVIRRKEEVFPIIRHLNKISTFDSFKKIALDV